jgi:hypothetical protein
MMTWGLLIWQVFGKSWGLLGLGRLLLLLQNGDDRYWRMFSSGHFVLLGIRWIGHFLSLCGQVLIWSFGVDTTIYSFVFEGVVEDNEEHFYSEQGAQTEFAKYQILTPISN